MGKQATIVSKIIYIPSGRLSLLSRMICLLLFNLLSYTSAMDPDCMHCMHYIDQCSPSCPQTTTTDCGREMMNCPGPVDFQGCAMPGTCVALGEECPFYCPYVPPMDCGEGERTCPGPIDSKGCKTMDQCVPDGEDCPLQSPGSKDYGVVISGGDQRTKLKMESLGMGWDRLWGLDWTGLVQVNRLRRLKPANCSIPQVPTPEGHTPSVINNGTTLVACGYPRSCVSWQAGQDGWKDYATLSGPGDRGWHAAVVLPNDTIVVVGSNYYKAMDTGEVVGSGKQFPLQNSGRGTCAIHSDQNEFVTIGGKYPVHGKVDRYDSQGNYLGSLPDLIEARSDHACASFTSSNGEKGFLVAGGAGRRATEIFLPSENRWRKGGELPRALEGLRAFQLNGQVFVTGGDWGRSLSTRSAEVLAYDASTDTWAEIGKMEKARTNHAVVGVNLRALCPVQD